jgi:WD repeat-containing protein 89
VFTGGEDGFIRAWRQPDESNEMQDSPSEKTDARAKDRKKFKDEKRFKPY